MVRKIKKDNPRGLPVRWAGEGSLVGLVGWRWRELVAKMISGRDKGYEDGTCLLNE